MSHTQQGTRPPCTKRSHMTIQAWLAARQHGEHNRHGVRGSERPGCASLVHEHDGRNSSSQGLNGS